MRVYKIKSYDFRVYFNILFNDKALKAIRASSKHQMVGNNEEIAS